MKASNTPTPRVDFTCQVIRFWSCVRHHDAPPTRHLEHCKDCRRFFVSREQFQLDLRNDARRTAAPPSGIEDRILQALDHSERPVVRQPRRSAVTASLAVCVVLLGLTTLWQLSLLPSPGNSTSTGEDYAVEVAALVAAVRAMPSDLRRTLEAPTAQLVQDNSLGREVQNVYSDAKSALDFLAANFLPAAWPALPANRGNRDLPRQT